MPALPDVPNVLKAQVQWNDSADVDVYTNHYFLYSGSSPDSSDLSNFAGVVCGAFETYKSLWTPANLLAGCRVTDLTSSTAAQGITSVTVNGTGGDGDLAGGTAVVVSHTLSRRYRGGKPRNYYPWGYPGALLNRQSWTTTYIGDVATAIGGIYATIIGTVEGGMTIENHVNVSYYAGFTVFNPGGGKRAKNVPTLRDSPLVNAITGAVVLNRPGSQRRRNKS